MSRIERSLSGHPSAAENLMARPRTKNLRRRSGRSWLFRIFKRALSIPLAVVLASWVYSANHYAYYVGDQLAVGVAKGTIDIMLATGDKKSSAFTEFTPNGYEDPSLMYRPDLMKDIHINRRPSGWFWGTYEGSMLLTERLGLQLPYWRSKYHAAGSFSQYSWGAATFRNWQIPCWLITLALIVACAINFLLDRHLPAHLCVNCRYDLSGNTSGICPECGTAFSPSDEPFPRANV